MAAPPLSPRALQVLLVIAGLACCIAMSMPQVHIVALCADLGYGVARGADMLALMLGAGIFSRLASGWLADRIGGVRTLLIGSLVAAIAVGGLANLVIRLLWRWQVARSWKARARRRRRRTQPH